MLKEKYPWVTVVESNEIRGFSENNNLALRQAKGRYCFVVNDDTEFRMPTIDRLVSSIESLPDDVAIISPNIVNPDGSPQCCGRPRFTYNQWIANKLHLWKESNDNIYTNKTGLFQTYNILGAAFMIKTSVFKELGWLDERFFFCPEDIALSTLANKRGYKCYVDADAQIIHIGGMSGKSLSRTQTATLPAAVKGMLLYYSHGNKIKMTALSIPAYFIFCVNYLMHSILGFLKPKPNKYSIYSEAERNVICTIFKNASPKEIFIHLFNKLKNK